jgi:hypothetical protein
LNVAASLQGQTAVATLFLARQNIATLLLARQNIATLLLARQNVAMLLLARQSAATCVAWIACNVCLNAHWAVVAQSCEITFNLKNFKDNIAAGCKAEVHCTAWDSETKTTLCFATYHAKHTCDGGPCPATDKETKTHYAYFVTMNKDNKVEKFVKVWNDGYYMSELGW